MANRVVFRIEKNQDVGLKNGRFILGESNFWLSLSIDSMSSKVMSLGSDIDEIAYQGIMNIISPYNVYSLLKSSLSGYEYEEIVPILDHSSSYYFDTDGEYIEINKLSEDDKREYIEEFKETVKNAVGMYGANNIDIVWDSESDVYDIMHHSRNNSFGIGDSFSCNYIPKVVVDEMINIHDCGYCD